MFQRCILGILASAAAFGLSPAPARRHVLDLAAARRPVGVRPDGRAHGPQPGRRRRSWCRPRSCSGRRRTDRTSSDADPRPAGEPGRVHAAGEWLAAGARRAAAPGGRAARAQLPADPDRSAAAGEPGLHGPERRAADEPAGVRRAGRRGGPGARVVGCPHRRRRARRHRAQPGQRPRARHQLSASRPAAHPRPPSRRSVTAYVLPGQARTWTIDKNKNDGTTSSTDWNRASGEGNHRSRRVRGGDPYSGSRDPCAACCRWRFARARRGCRRSRDPAPQPFEPGDRRAADQRRGQAVTLIVRRDADGTLLMRQADLAELRLKTPRAAS